MSYITPPIRNKHLLIAMSPNTPPIAHGTQYTAYCLYHTMDLLLAMSHNAPPIAHVTQYTAY
jgi:hypothetical protein